MENREQEIRFCRAEVAAMKTRLQILESRLDALEGRPAVMPDPLCSASCRAYWICRHPMILGKGSITEAAVGS